MKPVAFLFFAAMATARSPIVYLIRHGEKPAHDDDIGLSMQGQERAQCLRSVFGAASQYNIGYIMAEKPKKDGRRTRPLDTVAPLAQDLDIEVDTTCGRDDTDCVKAVVESYRGPGNILICWEHKELSAIAKALGASNVIDYPSGSFNLIWTDPAPYSEIVSITSENCPGLDS